MDADQGLAQEPDDVVERTGVLIEDGRTSEERLIPGPTPAEVTPVSYTHLQVLPAAVPEDGFEERRQLGRVQAPARRLGEPGIFGELSLPESLHQPAPVVLAEGGDCLLYTSRCV